ncbi:hypothetical protein [Methylobacterium nigriterrae]|uniref:hypothetical protein n=1 Tax=Methylobacterium nigriterrae TaxID=3127512 RepID=UPI003013F90D
MEAPQESEGGELSDTALAKPYEPTPAEEAALATHRSRRAKALPTRIKITADESGRSLRLDHPDQRVGSQVLMASLGTASPVFTDGLLGQMAALAAPGQARSEAEINFMLAAVTGVEPRDEVEAMLATQMAAVHMATMTFARRLARTDEVELAACAERALNKLARTFTLQLEALKRHRSTGQQTVRVERVTVEAGGQAIVGAISAPLGGGRGGECDGT